MRGSGRIRTDVVPGLGDRGPVPKAPGAIQVLLQTRTNGPTLWNRTRTSRASTERADQLRKSGLRVPRASLVGVHAAPNHHHRLFGCQRADPWQAQGAPRALMHSQSPRAHPSRFEICNQISSRKSLVVEAYCPDAENSKGHSVLTGRPFSTRTWVSRYAWRGPPEVPVPRSRPYAGI